MATFLFSFSLSLFLRCHFTVQSSLGMWPYECGDESDSQLRLTALMHTATMGHADCVRLLIDAGADKEAKDAVRRLQQIPICFTPTFQASLIFICNPMFFASLSTFILRPRCCCAFLFIFSRILQSSLTGSRCATISLPLNTLHFVCLL